MKNIFRPIIFGGVILLLASLAWAQNNTVNIMFKNFTDLCVGVFLFRVVGYSIMKTYAEANEKAIS